MKIVNIAAALVFGLYAHAAFAQTPAGPSTPSTPSTPPMPASLEVPAAPPTPPAPPAAPKATVVEGTLFRTQRANGDRGSFVWLCTYNVAGSKRNVQFDESCPSTLAFELRR